MNISPASGNDRLSRRGRQMPTVRFRGHSGGPALDEFKAAAWVQAYDAAWLGQDWARLARYLAPDVHFVPYGSTKILVGPEAMITHLREFLMRAEVHEYNATDVRARVSHGVGFVNYRWQLDWTGAGRRRAAEGWDALALRLVDDRWQMIWRLPLRS